MRFFSLLIAIALLQTRAGAAPPALKDLPAALDAVSSQVSRTLRFTLRDGALPPGGHLQGVQKLEDGYLLSGSSGTHAYLLDTRPAVDACENIRLTDAPYRHAGGFQVLDDRFIAVGLEDNLRRDRSRIWILDGRSPTRPDPASPSAKLRGYPLIEISRKGEEKTSTAGAIALARADEGHLLVVGTWDSATLDFYASNGYPLTDSRCRFELRETWSAAEADRSDWSDPDYGSYQNIQLARESDGDWYLGAFCRQGEEDRIDLFALRPGPLIPLTQRLQKRARKTFHCLTTTFQAGGGWHIDEEGRLTVLACAHHSGIVEVFETPLSLLAPSPRRK